MDKSPLVNEQIDAGMLAIDEFDKTYPVDVAFWLREADSENWFLYMASADIEEGSTRQAYQSILKIIRPDIDKYAWLDPFQVKVVNSESPIVKDVLDLRDRYPGKLPIRYSGPRLGGISVDGAYIYPNRHQTKMNSSTSSIP